VGSLQKGMGIFWVGFIFQWEIQWTRSMARGPALGLVYGGPRTGPRRGARWSACARLILAMGVHREVGKRKSWPRGCSPRPEIGGGGTGLAGR
jgi:hypothetical protein